MGSTNYWEMASAVALGVAMVSMSCTSFAAVYFMENTIENKKAECEAFPVDEEVEAREIKVQAKQVAYKHVTRWGNLPALDRALLGGAVACMTAACHLAGNFGSRCFATFTVTHGGAGGRGEDPGLGRHLALRLGLHSFQLYQRRQAADALGDGEQLAEGERHDRRVAEVTRSVARGAAKEKDGW